MMSGGMRSRLLWAALAPVFLVTLALVLAFGSSRIRDANQAHAVRAQLMGHQVAIASEFGVFSGNAAMLNAIATGAAHEADVVSVAVFDAAGQMLASSGRPGYAGLVQAQSADYLAQQKRSDVDVWVFPVLANSLNLDDYFTLDAPKPKETALGQVVLEISRDSLNARGRETLMVALIIGAAGFLLGGMLALRLLDAATRSLRTQTREAESATRAKSRFLAAASHDLRQPTHALGMFVARLGQLPLDEATRDVVSNMDASVHALQDLLDGLLDISRLEAGVVRPVPMAAPMEEIFQNLRKALQPIAQGKGLRLRIRESKEWYFSDPVLLQSMLMNLASNAVRYTPQGTVLVTCRVTEGGTRLRLDVSDSGVGIAAEHQQAIFQEFYQVANSGRDRALGLGLGLSIVERTAKLLGHSVSLRSQPGCGTRFSIVVPRADERDVASRRGREERAALSEGSAGQGELIGIQVLMVEDDPLVRQAVQELLVSWGCEVHAVPDLDQAEAYLEKGASPDILLSDYRLGGARTGLQVIEAVRARRGEALPACLMSGDIDAALMQTAKAAGLTLLHKPVRPAKLRSLVRHLALVDR
jgi:signal transduction histidine kinase